MRKIAILILTLLVASCASGSLKDCQPTQDCWKRVEAAYKLHRACASAKAQMEDKYGPMIGSEVHIRHNGTMVVCR